jgi:putative DNA primase/helicase
MAINRGDVILQLEAAGLVLDGDLKVNTTKPVRCKIGQRGEKKGWYRLHELTMKGGDIVLVGAYGIWSGADAGTQKIELPKAERERLTPEQLEAIALQRKAAKLQAEAELRQQQERAAQRAAAWWSKSLREVQGANAYLQRKGLPPGKLFGARLSPQGNLVIPMTDAAGKVWGLQVIYSDPAVKAKKGRDKEFTPPGLAMKSHWFMMGMATRGSLILVAEGFATGATLHEATGLPVAVAFTANNLLPVSKALVSAYKGARIMVCADDDWLQKCMGCGEFTQVDASPNCSHCGQPHGKDNAGVTSAQAAAVAVNGAWVRPEFPTQRPADRKGATDFNDLHCDPAGGLHLVARQVEAAIVAHGWTLAGRAASPHQGGGGTEPRPEAAPGDDRPRARSVMDLDDLVERFVPVDDGSGDHLFDRWTRKMVKIKQAVSILPARRRWDDVKSHPAWIQRGAYYLDQIGFDPAGKDKKVLLNTWQGWPMEPQKGRCDRLLDLLRYLCGEDNGDEVYWWLLRWIAYPLQNPGAKLPSAVIMHGPQGTGKSTIWQVVSKIYGAYSTVLNQRGLEDKFNADWVDQKLFLLAEEVVTRQELWHIKNELKELVTGETVRVNGKHVGAFKQANHINIVFLSNEGQPLPLDNDDRRHLVVWTPPQREITYYDAIQEEIHAGGVAALYHHLLNLDLDGWRPHQRPPMTQAKKDLVEVSRSSEDLFLREIEAKESGLPLCPCLSDDLYKAYDRWCRSNGHKHAANSARFLNCVARRPGWQKVRARILVGAGSLQRTVLLPPEALLEGTSNVQGPTESESIWYGRCAELFGEAVREGAKAVPWAV